MHERPAQIGVNDPRPVVVPAREQAGASGRADGRNVEVLEPHALSRQAIEVRRANPGIAVDSQVAISLVVGDDHDHVGPAGWRARSRTGQEAQREGAEE